MNAPETIYLTDEDSNFEAETYWCEDKVGENDVKYIRADLVPQIKELSDEEILETVKDHFIGAMKLGIVLTNDNVLAFAKAILKKASEK